MTDPFIGQITAFGFNFAPRGWAQCNGQLMPVAQNTALFSLLGTTYGGDGRTTFALPDLRGRVPINYGTGPGLSTYQIGQRSGIEYVTLNALEMPSHSHNVSVSSIAATLKGLADEADGTNVTGASLANPESGAIYSGDAPDTAMHADSIQVTGGDVTLAPTGGSQPHMNMQPFLVVNWCIALLGLFPSRN
jgi:microcystin-dependent protein